MYLRAIMPKMRAKCIKMKEKCPKILICQFFFVPLQHFTILPFVHGRGIAQDG